MCNQGCSCCVISGASIVDYKYLIPCFLVMLSSYFMLLLYWLSVWPARESSGLPCGSALMYIIYNLFHVRWLGRQRKTKCDLEIYSVVFWGWGSAVVLRLGFLGLPEYVVPQCPAERSQVSPILRCGCSGAAVSCMLFSAVSLVPIYEITPINIMSSLQTCRGHSAIPYPGYLFAVSLCSTR